MALGSEIQSQLRSWIKNMEKELEGNLPSAAYRKKVSAIAVGKQLLQKLPLLTVFHSLELESMEMPEQGELQLLIAADCAV